jgi:hypothetical protein
MPDVSFETIPSSSWLLQPGTVVVADGRQEASPGKDVLSEEEVVKAIPICGDEGD